MRTGWWLTLLLFIACGPHAADGQTEQAPDSFVIELADGRAQVWRDNPTETFNDYRDFTYHGFLDQFQAHLIEVELWEGSTVFLIGHEHGDTLALDAMPRFSPDRQRFLTTSKDLEAGYQPNRLSIFGLGPEGQVRREFVWEPPEGEQFGPGEVRWVDSRTIEFTKDELDLESSGSPQCTRTPLRLAWSETTAWQVETRGPPVELAGWCS